MPVHLPGNLASVWRDKPAGGDSAKAKEARGSKSPFRHNLSRCVFPVTARVGTSYFVHELCAPLCVARLCVGSISFCVWL